MALAHNRTALTLTMHPFGSKGARRPGPVAPAAGPITWIGRAKWYNVVRSSGLRAGLKPREAIDLMDVSDAKFQIGLDMRRKVLGEEYVVQAFNAATDFTKPLQELVTRMAWGEVWARPGLDLKTRSLLNLAILTALNRPAELRLHIRGALRNGVTKEQMQEVFLQTAAYCGLPAAMDSFRIAEDVFRDDNV